MKKITLIVHNLGSNPIVRAYPLAIALQRLGYKVEIVGFLFNDDSVYEPYADKFDYKTVNIKNDIVSYVKGLPEIIDLIDGDIIYAFKPLMTSYFIGLLKSRFGKKHPLIMDAEDDELYTPANTLKGYIKSFFFGTNPKLLVFLLHLFLWPAKIRTVVSSKLQKRYGGSVIYHGPDETQYNPDKYDRQSCREKFNLPQDKTLLLFAGVPRAHKGIDVIINALSKIKDDKLVFVGAGPAESHWFQKAKSELKERCILLGNVDNSLMPELLTASDIIPIIQAKNTYTESQMPAKLFEALAMGKIIISTDSSDIGKVLGVDKKSNDRCGYIVNHGDVNDFIDTLKQIGKDPTQAKRRAKNGRRFYLENASTETNKYKLKQLLS